MREIKKGEHALLAVSFWYRPARKNTRLSAAIWSRHILTDLMLRELLAAWKLTIDDEYRLFMVSIFALIKRVYNSKHVNPAEFISDVKSWQFNWSHLLHHD